MLSVFSEEADEGETLPIITVLQKPTNESFRTIVNLLPLNGVWPFPWSSALIHYFKDRSDLLIYAPSIRVCLSMSMWSAPLSLPAKSIKEIFPYTFLPYLKVICKIAWERDESVLAEFWEVTLSLLPWARNSINSWLEETAASSSPMIFMLFLLSSRNFSSLRLFNKS